MNRPCEPFTDEERQLASRLEKLGPHGGPSPALDARILAAAHSAVAAAPVARRKPRWPVAFGLAASAVLAVGVAWQLRPLQEDAFKRQAPAAGSSAPASADMAEEQEILTAPSAEADITASETAAPAIETPAAVPAPVLMPPPTASRADKARTQSEAVQQVPSTPARKEAAPPPALESSPAADAYSPPSPPAPPAPPPPPPPPVAAPAPQAAPVADAEPAMEFTAEPEEVTVTGARAMANRESSAARAEAARRSRAEQQARRAPEVRHLARTAAPASVPAASPIAQDATLPVEDWLQRIRERRDSGALQDARDSLRSFVEAHPQHPLPDDLRPLLDTP